MTIKKGTQNNMNFELTASMMCANYGNLEQEVTALESGGIDSFHIDIMDGRYVPNFAMSLNDMAFIAQAAKKPLDVHLMIREPARYIGQIADCGADIITVHAEACTNLNYTIDLIKERELLAGVALNPATPLAGLQYILKRIDMVLIMTVNPGMGGQKLIPYTLDKVRDIKKFIDKNGLKTDIEVDGGVNFETMESVLNAGANIIVAGSAVFEGDIEENTKRMLEIMK